MRINRENVVYEIKDALLFYVRRKSSEIFLKLSYFYDNLEACFCCLLAKENFPDLCYFRQKKGERSHKVRSHGEEGPGCIVRLFQRLNGHLCFKKNPRPFEDSKRICLTTFNFFLRSVYRLSGPFTLCAQTNTLRIY